MKVELKLNIGAWLLSVLVVVVAFISWGQSLAWQSSSLSVYTIFPLLGLVAFSLMWTHYVVSVARQMLGIKKTALSNYFETTSFVVLVAILLHPGLLWLQLWKNGFGLPPQSYLNHYVAPGLRWAAVLGTVSWWVFLTYELRRKFESKSWWQYISYASDIAMLAILIHALKLGTQLHGNWLRKVWYFYGATLIACLAYTYTKRFNKPPKT